MKLSSPKFDHLAQLLKGAREARGLSQAEVAKKLGYTSPQFISNMERGLCAPPLKAIKELVEMYRLKQDELIQAVMADQELFMKESVTKLRKALRA